MADLCICDEEEQEMDPYEEVLWRYKNAPGAPSELKCSPVTGESLSGRSLYDQIRKDTRVLTVARELYDELAGYGITLLSEADRLRATSSAEGWVFAAYYANLAANDWPSSRPPFAAFAAALVRCPQFGSGVLDAGLLWRYPSVPFDLADYPGWEFLGPVAK